MSRSPRRASCGRCRGLRPGSRRSLRGCRRRASASRDSCSAGVATLALGSLARARLLRTSLCWRWRTVARGFGHRESRTRRPSRRRRSGRRAAERSRVLAVALLGPPRAWIVGMPLVGVVGEVSWRLAWVVIPVCMAIVCDRPAAREADDTTGGDARRASRGASPIRACVRWSTGELLAFSGWAGALVYVGALLVDTYDLSLAATGLALGVGRADLRPGNLLFGRWVDDVRRRRLLVVLALARQRRWPFSTRFRPSVWFSRRRLRAALLHRRAAGRSLGALAGLASHRSFGWALPACGQRRSSPGTSSARPSVAPRSRRVGTRGSGSRSPRCSWARRSRTSSQSTLNPPLLRRGNRRPQGDDVRGEDPGARGEPVAVRGALARDQGS